MVVSFNPAMSTGNTIAFGKSESKSVMPRASMAEGTDTYVRQVGRSSEGLAAKSGRYIKNLFRAGMFAGALAACDKNEIPDVPPPAAKSEVAVANDMLKTISLASTSTNKSASITDAEIKALGLDTLYLEGFTIDNKFHGALGLSYGGKDVDGRPIWYSTEILSDGSINGYGKMKLLNAQVAEDGSKTVSLKSFSSSDGKYKGTKFGLNPVSIEFKLPTNETIVLQDGGVVKYYSKGNKEAFKELSKTAISYVRRTR